MQIEAHVTRLWDHNDLGCAAHLESSGMKPEWSWFQVIRSLRITQLVWKENGLVRVQCYGWNMRMSSNGYIFRVTGPFMRGIHWSPVNSPHDPRIREWFQHKCRFWRHRDFHEKMTAMRLSFFYNRIFNTGKVVYLYLNDPWSEIVAAVSECCNTHRSNIAKFLSSNWEFQNWKYGIFTMSRYHWPFAVLLHKSIVPLWPGPWFNTKMSSYQYRKSHCGDKTVVRSSYLHNGISYTGKRTSLYWISAQVTLYGDIDLGEHWSSLWLVVWWHQAITWTNVKLLSMRSSDNHLREISQEKHKPWISKICLLNERLYQVLYGRVY